MRRTGPTELLTQRDRTLLVALSRMRFLSYAQIRQLIFPGRAEATAHRRIRQLAERGWVDVWEEPTLRGGHPRYLLPTRRALAFAHDLNQRQVADTPASRVVELMSPRVSRRPLVLQPGVVPAFLAHQREVNHLLISLARSARSPLWSSSWDRPFPSTGEGIALPQPDFVLVFDDADGPRLLLGEHDRGQESLAHFTAAKVDRYAALAALPDVCERLFGFRSFTVWVTVIDTRFRRPSRRLVELARMAAAGGAADVMRFVLGGAALTGLGDLASLHDANEYDSLRPS